MNSAKYDSIKFKRGVKIIDVQDSYNFKLNHLNNSVNIPYDKLMENYRVYLNKNERYYIYCKSGKLSKRAVMVLSYLGYNVVLLEI